MDHRLEFRPQTADLCSLQKLVRCKIQNTAQFQFKMAKRNIENNVEMDEEEIKSLKLHDARYQIIKAMKSLQKALKPRYVRLDELVQNRGLQHLARYIFQYLNYQSLAHCRLVSKDWKDFIDEHCDNIFFHWKQNLSLLSGCKSVKLRSV